MTKFLSKSRARILLSVIILVAFIGTAMLFELSPSSNQSQSNGPVDKCGPYEPTDNDVKDILSLGKDIFTSPDWVKSYTVEPYKITLSRNNDKESIVAYTEYLIYACGYSQADLNNYFNDEGFNTIFQNYESHHNSDFCEIKDITLYIFDLVNEGALYIANYWVKQSDDKHILVMMLVFPNTNPAKLNEYSKKLFPELTSCP
jgi:hypothetical protein